MRQTAGQGSYVESSLADSCHGRRPLGRAMGRRHGFTLIEVIVAIAVLLIVSIGVLRFSVVSYDWGTNIVIRSMAQNLAELTAEQLAGSSVATIESMILSDKAVSPNFPANGTIWSSDLTPSEPETGNPSKGNGIYHVIVPGEFLVTGITSFFPSSTSQAASQKESLANLGESVGNISGLDNYLGAQFVKTGPDSSDLKTIFGGALPDTPSGYSTYLYSPAPNVTIYPVEHVGASGNFWWDSALLLFKSEFPRFLREVTVTRLFSGISSDPTQKRYSYSVNVIWVLSGHKQVVSVAGERSGVY